jgi:hypothetical protein
MLAESKSSTGNTTKSSTGNTTKSSTGNAYSQTGEPLCLYGDPAYPHRLHLQAPYRNGQITAQMQAFNKSMSSVRVSVEWLFGDIANYFKFMDFKNGLQRMGLNGKRRLIFF